MAKKTSSIQLKALGDGKAELLIYGVIGEDFFGDGVTAQGVKDQLDELGEIDSLSVRINSPGGSVFDGVAMYALLKEVDADIDVRIDGLAASMASVIAMVVETVTISEGAMIMIHKPWSRMAGDADLMRKEADLLDKIEARIIGIYQNRVDFSDAELAAMLAEETWLDAEDAVTFCFAD